MDEQFSPPLVSQYEIASIKIEAERAPEGGLLTLFFLFQHVQWKAGSKLDF